MISIIINNILKTDSPYKMDTSSMQSADVKLTPELIYESFMSWYFDAIQKNEIKYMELYTIPGVVSQFISLEAHLLLSGYNLRQIEAFLIENCIDLL